MHNKQAVPALLENGRAEATCPLPINNQKSKCQNSFSITQISKKNIKVKAFSGRNYS